MQGNTFGTRSQTVVVIWKDGRVEVRERALDTKRGSWEMARFECRADIDAGDGGGGNAGGGAAAAAAAADDTAAVAML